MPRAVACGVAVSDAHGRNAWSHPPMFGFLASLFRRPGARALVIEGHLCMSEIVLPAKVRTPLGSNVAIVTVFLDIHYVVENGRVVVRGVQLSRGGSGPM